jgi:predicted nucleic acid-binding protein
LILFEVANALRYHPVVKLSVEELVTATDALRDMGIIVEMSIEIWARTFEVSRTEGITTYDAAYLGLALLSDAVFVTADRKLVDGLSKNLKEHAVLLSATK